MRPFLHLKSWGQMYKVFIDHKPVVFLTENEISEKHPVIQAGDLITMRNDLRPYLSEINIDNPLQVVSENPQVDFKEAFRDFKWIEAAGGMVKRKDKYLMIKRNGLWDIPKGRIDKGESKEIACVREIEEECGVYGPVITRELTETHHFFKFKGKAAIKKTYWFMLEYDGTKKTFPQIEEGITRAKWMNVEDILALRGKTYGSISHVIDTFKEQVLDKI